MTGFEDEFTNENNQDKKREQRWIYYEIGCILFVIIVLILRAMFFV